MGNDSRLVKLIWRFPVGREAGMLLKRNFWTNTS